MSEQTVTELIEEMKAAAASLARLCPCKVAPSVSLCHSAFLEKGQDIHFYITQDTTCIQGETLADAVEKFTASKTQKAGRIAQLRKELAALEAK